MSQSSGAVCESRGDRPGLPVPNSPNGLCGRTATDKVENMRTFLVKTPLASGKNLAKCSSSGPVRWQTQFYSCCVNLLLGFIELEVRCSVYSGV